MVACMALGVAFTLFGCGGGSGSGERDATVRGAASAPAPRRIVAAKGCGKDLTRLIRSLDALRDQLAVGLTYDQYLEYVERLQRAYRAIPVETEPVRCVVGAGVPAERALNQHIEAANAWGDCLAESCELSSVEADIKRRWARASVLITDAQEGQAR